MCTVDVSLSSFGYWWFCSLGDTILFIFYASFHTALWISLALNELTPALEHIIYTIWYVLYVFQMQPQPASQCDTSSKGHVHPLPDEPHGELEPEGPQVNPSAHAATHSPNKENGSKSSSDSPSLGSTGEAGQFIHNETQCRSIVSVWICWMPPLGQGFEWFSGLRTQHVVKITDDWHEW